MANEKTMSKSGAKPVILDRSQHPLSRTRIDPDALYILRKLRREGAQGYLVGGAVRDILLGREPKDFDIGTDATPSRLRAIFQNSRTIGRRFKIIHVFFRRRGEGDKVVEVSTFRANRPWNEADKVHPDDMDQTGTAFGTPEEDAFRRDFTVNALFYNIADFTVVDHAGGLKDLEDRIIRIIGDPDARFEEDPVRMLRAIEFAVRLGFTIEPVTMEGIRRNAHRITEASTARLREELRQMHLRGITGEVLREAQRLGLFSHLFPGLLADEAVFKLLDHLDMGAINGVESPEFAYVAALCMASIQKVCPFGGDVGLEMAHDAAYPLVGELCDRYQISAHVRHMARELILCCYRLARGKSYRAKGKFARRAEFSMALAFYGAWVEAAELVREALDYWREYLGERTREASAPPPTAAAKRKRPRRRHRRPRKAAPAAEG